MKASRSKASRFLLSSLIGAACFLVPGLSAAVIYKISDGPTLYFTPELGDCWRVMANIVPYDNFDALIRNAIDFPAITSPFSAHWRMGIEKYSCFFEAQWTGRYYEAFQNPDDPGGSMALPPFSRYFQETLAQDSLMGRHVDNELIRLDRQWSSPSSHYTFQHWGIVHGSRAGYDRAITLDFGAMAPVLGHQPVAVRLRGAEWIRPWDDAGSNSSHVRSLPNDFVLRKSNSPPELCQICVQTDWTQSSSDEIPHRFFAFEIYGPGVGSEPFGVAEAAPGPATKPFGHLIGICCLWDTSDVSTLTEKLLDKFLSANNEPVATGVLDSLTGDGHLFTILPRSVAGLEPEAPPDDIMALQDELTRLREENDALRQARPEEQVRLVDQMAELQARLREQETALQEARDANQKALEEDKEALAGMSQKLFSTKRKLAPLEQIRDQLTTQVRDLQQRNERLKEESRSTWPLLAEIETLKVQIEKLQDPLMVARSLRLYIALQQAVDVIRGKVPDADGKRLVSKGEYEAMNESYAQLKAFLENAKPNILEYSTNPFTFTFTELGKAFDKLRELFLMETLHFMFDRPEPYLLSKSDFDQLNTALEKILDELQKIGGTDMRDTN